MNKQKRIIVQDKNKSFRYPIIIGKNIINLENKYLINLVKNKKVFVIYDSVFNEHTKINEIIQNFKRNFLHIFDMVFYYDVKATDKHKNIKNLSQILNFALSKGINRDSIIISIGGGVIGDIVGFASSILLRGVKYINIPTTLLAQVDSSVGGKTGINSIYGKNLIGTFYQPSCVFIDIEFLKTLPKRQLLAGFAEVIKYAFVFDKKFFNYIKKNKQYILELKSPFIEDLIYKCCLIKSKIVSLDDKEENIRAILNFGHTFGHAFESLLNYDDRLLHGEAVAVGMSTAFKLSVALNICSSEEALKGIELISSFTLPTSIREIKQNNFTSTKLINKFYKDKKVTDGKLTFILCKKIGDPIIKNNIEEKFLRIFLDETLNE